jgi:hypothetical protein
MIIVHWKKNTICSSQKYNQNKSNANLSVCFSFNHEVHKEGTKFSMLSVLRENLCALSG